MTSLTLGTQIAEGKTKRVLSTPEEGLVLFLLY